MAPGSRVLVETARGIFSPATVVAVLPDGWLTLAIDGERVRHDWPRNRYISADIIDVLDDCDNCGRAAHGGACEPAWVDSNASLGLPAQPGWSL